MIMLNQETIKVLTVRQPYASAIVNGFKLVENRSRPTKYRGLLYIHSSKSKPTKEAIKYCRERGFYFAPESYHLGHIIGSVELIDVVQNHESQWAIEGEYQWVLTNPRKFLVPIPAKGQLGIWNLPAIALRFPDDKM